MRERERVCVCVCKRERKNLFLFVFECVLVECFVFSSQTEDDFVEGKS